MSIEQELHSKVVNLFYIKFKVKPDKISELQQAGSARRYFRITYSSNKSIIAAFNVDKDENDTFIYFTDIFRFLNFNVPKIYSVAKDRKYYLLEDLGNTNLLDMLIKCRKDSSVPQNILEYYKKALSNLAEMQVKSHKIIDYSKCYVFSEFNTESIIFDLNYFLEHFVIPNNIQFDNHSLSNEFIHFAETIYNTPQKYFMFRDFQARNIMIFNDDVYFIDYQGGRKGSPHYDVASLLFQAKAEIPENQKDELLDHYIKELKKLISFNSEAFKKQFRLFGFLRVLQTLGAYGNRGLKEGKAHFIQSIPPAINNLADLVNNYHVAGDYPELNSVCQKIIKKKGERGIRGKGV